MNDYDVIVVGGGPAGLAAALEADKAGAKVLVLVGDSFPHCPAYTTARLHWKDEVDLLRREGVRVCSVAAAGSAAASVAFLREVARRGDGIFVDMGATLQQQSADHPHAWDVLATALLDCLGVCKRNTTTGNNSNSIEEQLYELVDRVLGPEPVLNVLDQPGKKSFQDYVDEIKDEEWWKFGAMHDDPLELAQPPPPPPHSQQQHGEQQPVFAYCPQLRIWERAH